MFGKLTNWLLKTGSGDTEMTWTVAETGREKEEVIATTQHPLQRGGRKRRDDTKTRWKC